MISSLAQGSLGAKPQPREHSGVRGVVSSTSPSAPGSFLWLSDNNCFQYGRSGSPAMDHSATLPERKQRALFFHVYFRLLPTSLFSMRNAHPQGAPFSVVAQQPGLDHQAGFHYRKEPADVAESCQLVWELPGDGGVIKSQGCGGEGEGSSPQSTCPS